MSTSPIQNLTCPADKGKSIKHENKGKNSTEAKNSGDVNSCARRISPLLKF